MAASLEDRCRDLNLIAAWLATDDADEREVPDFSAIVLLGNQVVDTFVVACKLARENPQARLVFSGGIGGATDYLLANLRDSVFGGAAIDRRIGVGMSEAEMYFAIARDALSVPESRMLVESKSANTGENVRFTLRILKATGIAKGPVALFQDPLLLRRAAATWDREREGHGLSGVSKIRCAAFVPQVEAGSDGLPRLVESQRRGTWSIERYLRLLLGEMERLHDDENGYGPRGHDYFDHVEIPEDVWASYLRLRESPLAGLGIR